MFDRFTDRARHVMTLCRENAVRLGSEAIDTEYLLLALCDEDTGIAMHALKRMDVLPKTIQAELEQALTPGSAKPVAELMPFTPATKRVLACAVDEARALEHIHIGTEHLLLGLLKEEQGRAAMVLQAHGVSLVKARESVESLVPRGYRQESRDGLGWLNFVTIMPGLLMIGGVFLVMIDLVLMDNTKLDESVTISILMLALACIGYGALIAISGARKNKA